MGRGAGDAPDISCFFRFLDSASEIFWFWKCHAFQIVEFLWLVSRNTSQGMSKCLPTGLALTEYLSWITTEISGGRVAGLTPQRSTIPKEIFD